MFFDCQTGQKSIDFGFGHFFGMAHIMKIDVSFNPMNISGFRAPAVMTRAQCPAKLIEKLRLVLGGMGWIDCAGRRK